MGLYGLDAQHGYHAELHPLWGLAVRVATESNTDTWVVFARNFGNEGGCSSRAPHRLPLRPGRDRFILDLPTRVTGGTLGAIGVFRDVFGDEARVDLVTAGKTVRVSVPMVSALGAGAQLVFGEIRIVYQ